MVNLAIFVTIVGVISQTEDLTSQKRICSYGFGVGARKTEYSANLTGEWI